MTNDSPRHLVTASRVKGTSVFDPDGDRFSHIEDLSIDEISGQVLYVRLSFGGFLRIMERFPPPLCSELTYDVDRAGYGIPFDKEQTKSRPPIRAMNWKASAPLVAVALNRRAPRQAAHWLSGCR